MWNGKLYNEYNDETCEIKNGHGMIKLYKYKNIVLFEGEYLNGEKGGHGKLYHDEETAWNR